MRHLLVNGIYVAINRARRKVNGGIPAAPSACVYFCAFGQAGLPNKWGVIIMRKRILSTIAYSLIFCLIFSMYLVTTAYADTVATKDWLFEGGRHFLVIKADGNLWAWGNNRAGQLGDGTTIDRTSGNPVKVMENVRFVSAGGGVSGGFSLAITNDNVLWAWGNNEHGKLGDGTVVDRHSPVRILDGVKSISAGERHSLAIKTDGSLWAWGFNMGGELGDGTRTNRHSPVKIMDGVETAQANPFNSSWAIKNDGSLWVSNMSSQIRNFGNFGYGVNAPVKIMDNVKSMGTTQSGNSLYFISSNDVLRGYGTNSSGQLGDGSGIDRDELVWITDNVTSVHATHQSIFALKNDNTLWGWGSNLFLIAFDSELTSLGTTYSPIKLLDNVAQVVDTGLWSIILLKTDGSLWEYRQTGANQIMDGIPLSVSTPPVAASPTAPASPSASEISVVVDGRALAFDVPPQLVNNRTMVPLRAIFEEMGATIKWNSATQTVTATKDDTVVVLTIGSTSPTINGEIVIIDQPGVIVDGRTLAPLRFVSEAFGGSVEWNGNTQTAIITMLDINNK